MQNDVSWLICTYKNLNKVYKYIGAKGSVLQIRLILIVICIIFFWLFVSATSDNSDIWVFIFLTSSLLLWVYLIFAFSGVKYDHSNIMIINVRGEIRYRKEDLKTIRPILSFLPLYTIVFRDGKFYRFSATHGRIIGFTDAIKGAEQIRSELLSINHC